MEIELPQIIFQMINFALVVFVLNRFLYKPVLNLLEDRKKKVLEASKAADQAMQEKTQIEAKRDELLKKAKKDAVTILAQARSQAAILARNQEEASHQKLSEKRSKVEKELKELKKEALEKQAGEIKEAALLIAEKVLAENIDEKKQSQLLESELNKIIESI